MVGNWEVTAVGIEYERKFLATPQDLAAIRQSYAAADLFAENGVERTFITIKAGGVYYKDACSEEGRAIRPERTLSFADTSGTGDLVSAVIIDETLKGTDMDATAKAAMDAAAEFLSELSDERPY